LAGAITKARAISHGERLNRSAVARGRSHYGGLRGLHPGGVADLPELVGS
jgi:hypothetical protein